MVYEAAKAVKVPVIGIGGIATANDALEFIMAGASAVQVGTAIYANPCTPLDIIDGIKRFMQKEGVRSISELVGAAL
jgi:dihydroorotate dehydrogenase (NAD+) catalytic subunit